MPLEVPTELGRLIFSEEAVASLVGAALLDVPGLSRFPLRKVKDGLRDFLGRQNLSRGIRVSWREGAVSVEVDALVDPTVRVADLVGEVVARSREAVSQLAELPVADIRVKILGTRSPGPGDRR